MRKIACVTGTRADYGYLKPIMREIEIMQYKYIKNLFRYIYIKLLLLSN